MQKVVNEHRKSKISNFAQKWTISDFDIFFSTWNLSMISNFEENWEFGKVLA